MREEVTGAGQGWFAASDPVAGYWLARCDAFEVYSEDGRLFGVVAGVDVDSAGRASMLFVDQHRGHPLQLDPDSVTWVDPWQRVVVVVLPPRRPRTARARAVAHAAGRGAGQAAAVGASGVGATSTAAVAAARRAAPPTRRFTLWLAARTAYALAFAGWLYGAFLYAVSRVAVRVLLAVLRVTSRLGVWIVPPLAHAAGSTTRRAVSHLAASARPSQPSRAESSQDRGSARPAMRKRRGSLYW